MTIAHAADLVLASAAPSRAGMQDYLPTIGMFAAMFGIFYFLIMRPQQNQRRERERLLAALKRGDKVVTTGGLHGTITGLNEHTVTVRVADQVRLEFDRSAIGRVVVEGAGEKDA